MPISFSTKISVAPDVTFRAVGEESVLLSLKTGSYLGLDPMGTRMWELLTSAGSIQSAFDTLLAEYEVEESLLRKDLQDFIRQIARKRTHRSDFERLRRAREIGPRKIKMSEIAASPILDGVSC